MARAEVVMVERKFMVKMVDGEVSGNMETGFESPLFGRESLLLGRGALGRNRSSVGEAKGVSNPFSILRLSLIF